MLSLAQLIAAGIAPTAARATLDPLNAACAAYAIDTPRRLAAFIGQAAVESKGLSDFEEDLYYTSAERVLLIFKGRVSNYAAAAALCRDPQRLACAVYGGRYGNGALPSRDGWTYRGRGAFGLTFLANYRAAARDTGRPYVEQPDLVAQPRDALLTAAWYWGTHKLNDLADRWQIDAITREVNGPGMVAPDQRLAASARAYAVLNP